MSSSGYVVKCRGLPWSCTEDDLRNFFEFASRSITLIKFTKDRNGRSSGEAYVAFDNRDDYNEALKKNKEYIGKRYVEIIPASSTDISYDLVENVRHRTPPLNLPHRDTVVLKLGGLPFNCTVDEIARFFHPIPIVENGIMIAYDRHSGKSKGEAFVAFPDDKSASRALDKNREYIQHRYVDIRSSSHEEMLQVMNPEVQNSNRMGIWDRETRIRATPYERSSETRSYRRGGGGVPDFHSRRNEVWADRYGGGNVGVGSQGGGGFDDGYGEERSGGGPMRRGWREEPAMERRGYSPRHRYQSPSPEFCIRMRGLPYRATEHDIIDFFKPLRPASIDLLFEYGNDRPTGEAIVEFENRVDCDLALERNRMYMGTRYIELIRER